MTEGTRIDRKNAGMSTVAELLGIGGVVCHARPMKLKGPNGEIVDVSVSASLSRTVNTSVTTLITLLALFILGAASIREFAFPLIIGMVAGTYSSNLLSGPLWAWLMDKKESRRQGRRAKPAPEHADA